MKGEIRQHHPDRPLDFTSDWWPYMVKYRQAKMPGGDDIPAGLNLHWQYGIFSRTETAELKGRQNSVVIMDAVTPASYIIALDRYEIHEIPFKWGKDDKDEFNTYLDKQFYKAQKRSDKVKGVGVGKMFSTGVADGCAFYVITKLYHNKARDVEVEWRGFHPDRYVDQVLGYGGRFPRHAVEHLCRDMPWSAMASR